MSRKDDPLRAMFYGLLKSFTVITLLLCIANALHPVIAESTLSVWVAWLSWIVIVIGGAVIAIVMYSSFTENYVAWHELLSEDNEPASSLLLAFGSGFTALLVLTLWHPAMDATHDQIAGAVLPEVMLCGLAFVGMQVMCFASYFRRQNFAKYY